MRVRGWALASIGTLAFSGVLAVIPVALGTSDLDAYEHAFFSLDRGTALHRIQVLGHPIYTLAIGLGARLPLLPNLGASLAAVVAPYSPTPLTYWLLITCAISLASFVVRHALEPLCGRIVTWLALIILFCSAPMVNYTLIDDWPHVAITYPAFVGCVFGPHAMLTAMRVSGSSATRYLRIAWLAAAVGGLIGASHPGYWPLLALTLALTSSLALCRSDHAVTDRMMGITVLGAVSLLIVGLQVPDMLRELSIARAAFAGIRRGIAGPEGDLIATNIFPFGDVEARLPFTHLLLALSSLAIGLVGRSGPARRLIVGSAGTAILLGVGAAEWRPEQLVFAPSSTWGLRDPALAFAILSGALASIEVVRRQPGPGRRLAATALALAAIQGPAYAVSLISQSSPEWTANYDAWNRDTTSPEERVARLGLRGDRVFPGARLVLWPGESARLRLEKHPTADFADAGYLLVSAWTRQRTMRQLATPNDVLFYQSIELTPAVLCDSSAVQFLQLRYLLVPPGIDCEPWEVLPDVRVDGRLEVRVAAVLDRRVRALPAARLTEPSTHEPALSPDSTLIRTLTPLTGTLATVGPGTVTVQLTDPSVAAGHALLLPVAYDSAWRSSNGQTVAIAGLLGLVDVTEPRVTLDFAADAVAWLRAISATLAQLLAAGGLLGLAFLRPLPIGDAAVAAVEHRAVTKARLEWSRLHPHTRWYLLYAVAVMLSLPSTRRDADETSLATALVLPLTAVAVARMSRSRLWRRAIGGILLSLVFFRTIATGSLSPDALHDPPFWAITAVGAIVVLAFSRRWRVAAAGAAAVAGACAMTSTLVAMLPATLSGPGESLAALSGQIGVVAVIALVGVWLHAIVFGGGHRVPDGANTAMARGALLIALLFTLAGVVPVHEGLQVPWALALGALLGLAGARPPTSAARPSEQAMMKPTGTS